MKNLKLTINRLHIRFEDDYFSQDTPFSLGFVCDKLQLISADTDWTFENILEMSFYRVAP
jgi:hypothetical protein